MPTIMEIVTAKMESKKLDGEIQLKSQGERMPDSELGTEINSLSAKSNNANRPSPLKSTPELNLHQPAVETKRRREEWEIIQSSERPHTVQPSQVRGYLHKKIKQPRWFFNRWHKVLIDSVSVQVLFTNSFLFMFSIDILY